ncbi:MAG TPA: S8 family serine peptidase [Gemmatimonadaceae bacterium]|nr:S8 family serine peptidase [Gemmatimonadaceae bacterium]
MPSAPRGAVACRGPSLGVGRLHTSVTDQASALTGAWKVTRGAGATVAVIDEDATAQFHPEFGRRVRAVRDPSGDGTSHTDRSGTHGINVAGLVLASGPNVMGLAPAAVLLPLAVLEIRVRTGTRAEAHALQLAANSGADVICCAWAPPQPSRQTGELPSHTRDAINHCLTHGRDGKGCVIVFSAGNDGSDLALNGYASHPGVIAVGACNHLGKHPAYSGWGDALWCVFPSNDPSDPVGATMTYVTTAPAGSLLDGEAYYTTRFGFTSAATAAIAGICALIVSANPSLTSTEVKAVLRDSCEKIDVESETYDERGHNPLYGYGRPDVARAVELARQR